MPISWDQKAIGGQRCLSPLSKNEIEICPEIIPKAKGQGKPYELSSLITTPLQGDSQPLPHRASFCSYNDWTAIQGGAAGVQQ